MGLHPVIYAIIMVLNFCSFVLLVTVIMSLLIHFNVLNYHNHIIKKIYDILMSVTEPVLKRIRRYVPPLGGLDLSPLIAFFAINLIEYTLLYYFARPVMPAMP